MANRLQYETSPYLLQHKENPVDWYPWGAEASARAKQENRPILLSVGYSACHWCHVMEHESFENPAIAAIMNDNFVNVKVDREERPDVDSIYMNVVQAMTGRGGWPMTVFLTPDGMPFYAGTYFPPEDRQGMPGFPRVLESVAAAYRDRPEDVASTVQSVRDHLGQPRLGNPGDLEPAVLDQAYRVLLTQVDWREGGLSGAPKFPQPMLLEFLLRVYRRQQLPAALQAVELTLTKMARGGMYDQAGGGFHRYSVDAVWLVPHFEKMLYDNAQLALVYLQAFQVTGNQFYRRICEETLDYVRREMTSPEGAFYSTQDADSEGEEGKFYVWTPEEVEAALGATNARIVNAYFDVTAGGNFEHRNILHVPRDADVVAAIAGVTTDELEAAVSRARPKLLAARAQRVWPGRDDKVLTSWNGLMLRAFAEAAAVLGRDDYRDVAVRNAEFLWTTLQRDGRLLHSYKDGQAKLNGYLEDYAFLADGLIALYQLTFEPRWYQAAGTLAEAMLRHFWDDDQGGFFDTSDDHEALITRPKDLYDSATPSGNAVAAEVLQRLAAFAADPDYAQRAATTMRNLRSALAQAPAAFGRMLCAVDFYLEGGREVAIVGDPARAETGALLRVVREQFRPNAVVALRHPDDAAAAEAVPLLADRGQIDGKPTAYVCRNYVCQQPTTDPDEARRQLDA